MRVIPALALAAVLAFPTAASAQTLLEGRDFLDWMGLDPGDTLVFQDGDAQRCVTVREPRTIRGRRYAEMRGLMWPGLASDSRILVPLDGSVGFSVIATPGPRPNPVPLIETATSFISGAPPSGELDGPRLPAPKEPVTKRLAADGWYAVGGLPGDPARLVYVRCSWCMDAGTRVVLDRGRGIRSITTTTIVGTSMLTRVEGASCAERSGKDVELEVYVLPQDDDRP